MMTNETQIKEKIFKMSNKDKKHQIIKMKP